MARSRTGCAQCKKRKRKCDETQPECLACQSRGLQCGGYQTPLRWSNAIASRGRFAGATTPAAPVVAAESSISPASTTSPSAAAISSPETVASQPASADGHESYASLANRRDEIRTRLFAQFMQSGLHRLYNTKSRTWVGPFFEQMSKESEALFSICIAIQCYINDGASVFFLELADHALRTFRTELAGCNGAMVPKTMCAGLLVCTLSLFQARPWTKYLELMTDLYNLHGDFSTIQIIQHEPYIQHALEVMSIMDLPTFVIGRVGKGIGVWKRLRAAQDTWVHGRTTGVEDISGMPRSLLDVIARVYDDDDYVKFEDDAWMWPGEIGEFLQCQLWDSWRFAAILNSRRWRLLQSAARTPESTSQTPAPKSLAPSSEVILCRMLSSVNALFQGMEKPENCELLVFNGLLYPLVAASLEQSILRAHPEWKNVLSNVRDYFLKKDSAKVVHVLFEILNEAWAAGTDGFDIDGAARRRNMEVAIF